MTHPQAALMAACCQCARSRSARYISTPPPSTMALPPSRRRECCVSPATGQPRQATYNSACQIPTAMRAAPKSGARDGPAWVPQPAAARSAAGTASGMTTRKYAAIARPLNQRALRKGTRGAEDSSLSAARLGRTQRATGTSAASEPLCPAGSAAIGRRPLIGPPAAGPYRRTGTPPPASKPRSPQLAAAKAPSMADSPATWPANRRNQIRDLDHSRRLADAAERLVLCLRYGPPADRRSRP
jgi:hypothetical protein